MANSSIMSWLSRKSGRFGFSAIERKRQHVGRRANYVLLSTAIFFNSRSGQERANVSNLNQGIPYVAAEI